MQFTSPSARHDRGGGRRRSARRRCTATCEQAGLRIVNGTASPRAPTSSSSAPTTRFDYAELRGAVQAALAGADLRRRRARRDLPDARRAVAGHRRGRRRGRGRHRASSRRTSASPTPAICTPRSTGSGPGRALVVGDRLDADLGGRARAGIDGAIVLTGATTARRRGAHRRPIAAPRRAVRPDASLADLVLGRRALAGVSGVCAAVRACASSSTRPPAAAGRWRRCPPSRRAARLGVAFRSSTTTGTRARARARPRRGPARARSS